MKTPLRTITSLFAVALAVIAAALPVKAADENVRVARVIKVKEAQYKPIGQTQWRTLSVGDKIAPGGWIRTSADGSVDLRLGESPVTAPTRLGVSSPAAATLYTAQENSDNLVHVFGSTLVGIEKLVEMNTGIDRVSETELNLKQGKILGNVKKLSAASKYEVKLPTGVAGIRGSTYLMSSDGTITMVTGSAVVTMLIPVPGGNGATVSQTFTINAGETFNPNVVILAVQNAAAAAAAAGNTPDQIVAAAQAALTALASLPQDAPGSPGVTTPADLAQIAATQAADLGAAAAQPSTTVLAPNQTVVYVSPK